MTIVLRPIGRGDLAALAHLHAACFPDDAWDASALATVLSLAGTEGRVAMAEDGALCALLIDQCLGEVAEILTLCVAPSARRQGVARALLRDGMARARALGAKSMVLEVAADNVAGLALYRSLGFLRHGTRKNYYRRPGAPPVDAWRLGRAIDDDFTTA